MMHRQNCLGGLLLPMWHMIYMLCASLHLDCCLDDIRNVHDLSFA